MTEPENDPPPHIADTSSLGGRGLTTQESLAVAEIAQSQAEPEELDTDLWDVYRVDIPYSKQSA